MEREQQHGEKNSWTPLYWTCAQGHTESQIPLPHSKKSPGQALLTLHNSKNVCF